MNSTDQEIESLLSELTGSSGLNTISNNEPNPISGTSHMLLEVLKIVKEMSQRDKVSIELNYRPPGVILFDQLRIDTNRDMVNFSYVFAILSVITVVLDQLVRKCRRVCLRTRRLFCVSYY